MSINGYMMTPLFSTTVYDGKKSIDDITIMSSDLEANGITSVDQVELKFHIYNAELRYNSGFRRDNIYSTVNNLNII